jgi:hypothetical protein
MEVREMGTRRFMYPCTDCSGDAFLGYSAKTKRDWGGKVKKGERLCTACFRKRVGFDMFHGNVRKASGTGHSG